VGYYLSPFGLGGGAQGKSTVPTADAVGYYLSPFGLAEPDVNQ